MLFGLIAAAAPILLHMFRKRTARRIVWGAWQFLAESMRQKRRRILIEEIILLVVRTAILALAALAFARPFLPEMGFFGGGEKDVVIVLDASGSMNLKRKDGTTAFEAAVEEARELIDRAPHGVSFGLVLGGRDAEIRTALSYDDLNDKIMDVRRALYHDLGVPFREAVQREARDPEAARRRQGRQRDDGRSARARGRGRGPVRR